MRGSLRIRHSVRCAAGEAGKTKDCRLCTCSPSVLARVGGVNRSLGALPRGWRQADLIEFERKLLELREQVLTGRTPAPTRPVTLDEFVGPWFEKLAMQVELGRISPLTFNKYEGDWRRHLKPAFGRLPLAAIDQDRLVRYMRTKMASGLSESTVKSSLIPLCGMLTDAVSDGHIQSNPLRSPKRARHRGGSRHDILDLQVKRQPPKHLEVSESLRLLDATPPQYRDMVLLALTTGFRRNEILGLQWEWIDFGAMRIDLRGQLYWRRVDGSRAREAAIVRCKYDSEREVPLFSGLAELLGPLRQASGFVFLNPNTGKPWKEGKPTELFLEPAYEACGLRRPGRMWHQLRHTYASVLAAGGVKRHEVEQLMGHKTAGTTGLYTHLFREAYADVERALVSVYNGGVPPGSGDVSARPESRPLSYERPATTTARRF